MNLTGEFSAIWAKYDPSKTEEGKFLLTTFEGHRKECQKLYLKSYYLVLILTIIYFCLDLNLSKEIEIFSIKLTNIFIIKWAILPVFCFVFYQGVVFFIQENHYRQIIQNYIDNHLPEILTKTHEDLIYSPSIFNFERFLANKYSSTIASYFFGFIIIIFLVVPWLLLSYIMYQNILDWGGIDSLIFKIIILVVSFIFITRILGLLISLAKVLLE